MKFKRRKNKYWLYMLIAVFVLVSLTIVQVRINKNIRKLFSISADTILQKDRETAETAEAAKSNSLRAEKSITPDYTDKIAHLKVPILMYHYIRDYNNQADKTGTGLSVSPGIFSNQIDDIKSKGYQPITFYDLESGNIPEKPIILTFDDGYADFYQNAFRIMKEKGIKGVNYVIANFNSADYMTGDQIKEVSSQGIEIGSHTLKHPDLSKLDSKKALIEIEQSKNKIENITGKKVISFCYPSGKYSEEIIKLVGEKGYKYAVTTKPGIADFSNKHVLSRYRITNETNIKRLLR